MARDVCALRPVAPHAGRADRGPGHDQAALARRREHVRELRSEQGETARRVQPGRLRHRRRDPVPSRAEQGSTRGPSVGAQLAPVPRRDGRLRRAGVEGRANRRQPHGRARALPLPGAGADGDAGARGRERRAAARDQVLQHGRAHDRRAEGARSAPRDVGRARARALGPVGGARGRQGRDRRSREGLRPSSGRLARVRDEHARVGLDPFPAARGLHR